MSYLTKFIQIRQSNVEGSLMTDYRIQWRTVCGIITVCNGQVQYKKYTALGGLLRANREFERKFVSDAIEKSTGSRPTDWRGY